MEYALDRLLSHSDIPENQSSLEKYATRVFLGIRLFQKALDEKGLQSLTDREMEYFSDVYYVTMKTAGGPVDSIVGIGTFSMQRKDSKSLVVLPIDKDDKTDCYSLEYNEISGLAITERGIAAGFYSPSQCSQAYFRNWELKKMDSEDRIDRTFENIGMLFRKHPGTQAEGDLLYTSMLLLECSFPSSS